MNTADSQQPTVTAPPAAALISSGASPSSPTHSNINFPITQHTNNNTNSNNALSTSPSSPSPAGIVDPVVVKRLSLKNMMMTRSHGGGGNVSVPTSELTLMRSMSSRQMLLTANNNFMGAQPQPQQHSVDDDISFIDAVFTRVFNNLALFKVKVMYGANIPLSETEQETVLQGKEMNQERVATFKEALRQVQETMLAKKKANIGLSQLSNIGNLFGGGGGVVPLGSTVGTASVIDDQFDTVSTSSARLAAANLADTPEKNKKFNTEADATTSPTATTKTPRFAQGKQQQQQNSKQLTATTTTTSKQQTAHSRKMSTMQQQIKECTDTLSDLVKNHLDGMFRFALEDLTLRQTTQKQMEEMRLAPRRILDAAVGEQREQMDTTSEALRKEILLNHSLTNKVKEMESSIKTRDEIHKQRLDGFLREVCILKEQLFRSYRDKNYVGKPVDLMTAVEDTESGEDVTIDQLLEYRKQVKISEKLIADANLKVRKYQEELKDKEELMKRIEDRARSKEASVANIKREMDQLNELAIQQREELRILRTENARLKGETAVDKAAVGSQATFARDEAAQSRFENGIVNKMSKDFNATPQEIFTKLDEFISKHDELAEENEKLKKQLVDQRAEILAEFVEKIETCERERDAAVKLKNETLAKAENAMRVAAEAEEMIEVVKYRAAEEVISLSEELRTAQNAVHVLRLKAVAVARAHLTLATRYQVLKARNGLDDYKKKANSFHFARAEIAVRTAQANVAEVRRQCAEELEKAAEKVKEIQAQSAAANDKLEAQSRKHYDEMRAVQMRVTTIENASRLLLGDYEKLRDEHFKNMLAMSEMVQRQNQNGGGGNTPLSSRPTSSKGVPLLRPGSGNNNNTGGGGGGVLSGRVGSAGRSKSAAPLPPPSALPSTQGNNNDAVADAAGSAPAATASSAVSTIVASSSKPVTVGVKNRHRIALHETLEKVLDTADWLTFPSSASTSQKGNNDSTTTKPPLATTDSSSNANNATDLSAAAIPYNTEKLRQYAFSKRLTKSSNAKEGDDDDDGDNTNNNEETNFSLDSLQGAAAALPPLPQQALLASSTLQVEQLLGTLAVQLLTFIGKDATATTAMALLSRGGSSNVHASGGGVGGDLLASSSSQQQQQQQSASTTAVNAVAALGYTSANNLAHHLMLWAAAAAATGTEEGAEQKKKRASSSKSSLPSSSTATMASVVPTSSSASASSAAALLAALAAGSWSKLRTLMPAYHAVRATIQKLSVVGDECPAMQLPKMMTTQGQGGGSSNNSISGNSGVGGGSGGTPPLAPTFPTFSSTTSTPPLGGGGGGGGMNSRATSHHHLNTSALAASTTSATATAATHHPQQNAASLKKHSSVLSTASSLATRHHK